MSFKFGFPCHLSKTSLQTTLKIAPAMTCMNTKTHTHRLEDVTVEKLLFCHIVRDIQAIRHYSLRKTGFRDLPSTTLEIVFRSAFILANYYRLHSVLPRFIDLWITPHQLWKIYWWYTYSTRWLPENLNKMWGRSNNEPHVKKYLVFHHHITQK